MINYIYSLLIPLALGLSIFSSVYWDIIGITIFIISIVKLYYSKHFKSDSTFSIYIIWFSVYVFSYFLYNLRSNDILSSIIKIKGMIVAYGAYFLIFTTLVMHFSKIENSEKVFKLLIIGCKIILFIHLLQFLLAEFIGISFGEYTQEGSDQGRYFGIYGDSIGFAYLLPLMFFIVERKYVWVLLFFVGILITQTRGAIFASILGSIFIIILTSERKKLVQIVVSSFVALSLFIFIGNEYGWLSRFEMDKDFDESLNQRTGAMSIAVDIFTANPIIGIGPGNFQTYADYAGFWTRFGHSTETLSNINIENSYFNANNQLLEILVDGGIIGFVFFLIFHVKLLSHNKIKQNKNNPILISTYYFIVVLLLFNQSAVFIIPNSILAHFYFVSIAIIYSNKKVNPKLT